MVKSNAAAEVVYDPSASYASKSRPRASSEWRQFMSGNLSDMYRQPTSGNSTRADSDNEDMDIRKLLKDIEYLGASNMTWKERKQLENRNVVALGGKPPKKHRTPLSVAKPAMKNQKKREQKKIEEDKLLGRFSKRAAAASSKQQKIRTENKVLRATEGHFRKGILDVKHLLAPKPPKSSEGPPKKMRKGNKQKKGKGKKKGRRKGR
ncbi:uncharacterized protein LOC109711678 [Ananas comosus]|uniref:Uncharacterized protein LOC109711678 n=1 Tax=Ananas comosus TaxID=4615 RepID=A0A6P5FAD4_ANACO|nr:uncharacterized protein LOC109711678 [Ananas comosus]XP_020090419.1 uncharacterized protein LOC109711678 [Ananas comosus]